MIPDMTCKQGPHVRTRPQTCTAHKKSLTKKRIQGTVQNLISRRHTPARNQDVLMPSSQLYMINRKAVPKLARRRTVASTWHDIIRGIFTLRYRWPETSCDMKIWRLCPLTKLYIMSNCNEWSAGSPTRRTVDMTQPMFGRIG